MQGNGTMLPGVFRMLDPLLEGLSFGHGSQSPGTNRELGTRAVATLYNILIIASLAYKPAGRDSLVGFQVSSAHLSGI